MAGNLTAMIAAIFSGGVTPDPYYEYTTLLLPGNGTNGAQNNTFLDGSTNNFTITRNGNTTQGTFSPFSQTGWGNYFNGSSQYLTWSPTSGTAFGTAAFTVEVWIYLTSAPSTQYIIDNRNASQLTNWAFAFGLTTSGKLGFYDGVNAYEESSASIAVANQWMHCVTVRDASNNISVYINGTRVATGTSTTNISVSSNTSYIGTRYNVANLLGGYVSNTRITKGRAVYDPTQSNLTVPTTPLTRTTGGTNPPQGTECSLLTCQSNRFLDSNGVNVPASSPLTITATGSPTVAAFSPFNPTASWSAATYGGSGYFDGSGDYLSLASSSALGIGSGDFTIEFWINFNSVTGFQTLFDFRSTQPSSAPLIYLNNNSRLNYLFNSASPVAFGPNPLVTGAWYHVAWVRSGTTHTMYVNGASQATFSDSSGVTSAALNIGARLAGGAADYTNAYYTDFRFVKGTAVYTGAFTPPTAPITNAGSTSAASYPSTTNVNTSFASSATSLLLNFTNAGIYDATSKNDLETVGNAQISTTQSKWGGSSISFDGTGDYLLPNVATSDMYAFGTGDFTIEFWVRYNSGLNVDVALYDSRPTSTNGVYPLLFSNPTGKMVYYVSSAARITGTTTLVAGNWYHVALARSGTSTRLFINGSQEGSTYTDSNNYIVGTNRPAIGAAGIGLGADPLNGYIQDLRVTKGYARYVTGTGANAGQMVFNGTNTLALPTAAFPTL
jgi:hypothetical protein